MEKLMEDQVKEDKGTDRVTELKRTLNKNGLFLEDSQKEISGEIKCE